jgi:GMP synthase-like glutamine amidotransferase
MQIHSLQHVPFEGPAAIVDWARERGHDHTGTQLFDDDQLPAPDAVDLLVVLGGPMGVGDEYPWLATERTLIRETLKAGGSVVGICLGAQQLAAALGSEVQTHEATEIGWFPVEATDAASETVFGVLPETYPVFHWHGDRFAVPEGATLTATSEACRQQAFVGADGRALGLQFHLEATPESVRALVEATETLPAGEWVQSREQLLADDAPYDQLREALFELLDAFVADADPS